MDAVALVRQGGRRHGATSGVRGIVDLWAPFSETVDLVEALERRGVEYEQLVFPDEVHGFLLHRNWVAAYEAMFGFFERKLKRPIP